MSDPFVQTLGRWLDISMRRTMREFLGYARRSGLSMSQFGALFHLYRAGSCGVTEVGDHLGVTGGAASQMVDRLVGQGLVQRGIDPEDRRVKRIELTGKGERMLKEGLRTRQQWVVEVGDSLSSKEKETVIRALELLIEKMEQRAESAALSH
jgi:DNA-binding MarR family transcriptional regulator